MRILLQQQSSTYLANPSEIFGPSENKMDGRVPEHPSLEVFGILPSILWKVGTKLPLADSVAKWLLAIGEAGLGPIGIVCPLPNDPKGMVEN